MSDSDGLHRAVLITDTIDVGKEAGIKVLDCKSLNGESRIEIEFDTTELAGRSEWIGLDVIDRHGNFSEQLLSIDIPSLRLSSEVVSIPDANLATAIRTNLGLAPSDTITNLNLLDLTTLNALYLEQTGLTDLERTLLQLHGVYIPDSPITDLTGLEHAVNLKYVDLRSNQIRDLTPFTGLARLNSLLINDNHVSNVNPLAGLTQLSVLWISGNQIVDVSGLSDLKNLTFLTIEGNQIRDLTPLAGLKKLRQLDLGSNQITDITPLAELTLLGGLFLYGNQLSNLAPLDGLTYLEEVGVRRNPLSYSSMYTHIPALLGRGVEVRFDHRTPQRIRIVSGNNQEGVPGAVFEEPLVVEVRDEHGVAFEGVPVTFTATSGGGSLSATSVTTDSNGRAESTLTLGHNPATNTVTVSVSGSQQTRAFNAEGIQIPKTLEIISGNDQEGLPGAALENPFVVEVRDQTDKPLPGVQVTFSVTSGGGTLSATSVTTDSNGQAESILTLGPNPGTNTVTVSVTGSQEGQTVTAEGIRIPLAFWIISGDKQQGLPGEALANPFVVEVRDQSGDPLLGVQVTFSVTSGGGTLSVTSATTGSNGRTESILTLGPTPGTNTVEVGVRGI